MAEKEVLGIDVVGFAKSMAIIQTCFGMVLVLLIFSYFSIFVSVPTEAWIIILVAYPIIFFISGFFTGAIYAFLYNEFANDQKYIRFKVKSKER